MSLINSYMQVLNEGVKPSEVKGAVPATGKNVAGDLKDKGMEKPDGFDPKKPTEGHSMEFDSKEAKPSKLKLDNSGVSNPFDDLVQKILEEEDWESLDAKEDAPSDPGATADFSFDAGDLNMGIVSKETISGLRGYDWEQEQERIANDAAQTDNIGAAILWNFENGGMNGGTA